VVKHFSSIKDNYAFVEEDRQTLKKWTTDPPLFESATITRLVDLYIISREKYIENRILNQPVVFFCGKQT